MTLKDENIEWTNNSLYLLSTHFEPLRISLKDRIELTKLLQTEWSEELISKNLPSNLDSKIA